MTDRYEFTDNLGYLLNRCADQIAARFSAELEPFDISLAQWGALLAIHERGAASPSQIAARVGTDRGATTRLLSRMVEKGLIERGDDPKDGRAVVMSLSDETKRLMPGLIERSRAVNAQVLQGLPDKTSASLMTGLAELNAVLAGVSRQA